MFSNPQANVDQLGLLPGMHVADFGAGTGFYSIPLGKAVGDHGRVYSIDIQKDLLAKLKDAATHARVHNIEVMWGDLEKLGGTRLKDESVDFGLIANTLFQLPNKPVFIQEVKRVLKKGGRVALIDWTDSFGGIGPHPQDVIPEIVARGLFEREGFVMDRGVSAGDHHYGIIFKK